MAAYELIGHFIAEIDSRLLALEDEADATDKERAAKSALTTYSKDKPDVRTNDITGDGGFSFTVNSTNLPGFVLFSSQIRGIEYPYDSTQAEPNWIESENWKILPSGTTHVLRMLNGIEPTSSEMVRVHYSQPYVFAGDPDQVTMPDIDFYAVCDLATSYTLEGIANKLTALGQSTIEADTVNYRTKSTEARANAKTFFKRYADHMGIDEKGGKARAVAVVTDVDAEYSFQSDFLTHPRRWR